MGRLRVRYRPTMPRPRLLRALSYILKGKSLWQCIQRIRKVVSLLKAGTWRNAFERLADNLVFRSPQSIIVKNERAKVPFYAFSTLPLYTCPGMGECKYWCYSLKALRYPDAVARLLQNTLLMKFLPGLVGRAFMKILSGSIFRPYIDGDFANADEVYFWMELLKLRPDIRAYGYSKSWPQLLAYDELGLGWPTNYRLRLSSGSKWGREVYRKVKQLPIVGGDFLTPKVDGLTFGSKRYEEAAFYKKARLALPLVNNHKVFVCPGQCGDCANGQVACASPKFDGIPIINPLH